MNLSILHVITTIDLGGAEKQLLSLATSQKEFGHDVEVVFLKDKPALLKDFLDSGVKVDTSFAKCGFFTQCLKLKQRRFNNNLVIHAHLPRAELLCALSLRRESFIVTRHNSEPFLAKGPTVLSKLLSRFVLKRAFASISISEAVAKYLTSSREMSNTERNLVIHYGLKETSVSYRTKSKPRSRPIHLGTVSRLVPQKNISLLLGMLKELNSIDPSGFLLSVVGIGPLRDELQSISLALGIEDMVSWKGQEHDVLKFYRSLDVFVLASEYEGFGLVLLEAMSQGIPVVARRISAIPEVMGDKHPGLVELNDPTDFARKISSLMADKVFFDDCLDYQAKQLKKFSIKQTQISHEHLYRKVMGEVYEKHF